MLHLTEVHFKQDYFRFENYRLANSFIIDLRTKPASQGGMVSGRRLSNMICEHPGKEKEK